MVMFDPIIKKTDNIKSDILQIATNKGISKNEIDFNILKISTLFKNSKSSDWQYFEADSLSDMFVEEEITSTRLLLQQEYEIEYIPKEINVSFILNMKMSADKTKTKIYAHIDPSSVIEPKKSTAVLLLQALYKRKLMAGLYIAICEDNLKNEILKFLHHVKDGKFKEEYKMLIGKCYEPTETIHDKVLLHFKKKEKKDNQMINPVQVGELIITYVKAKAGKNGRNCRGELIKVDEPLEKYKGKIVVDKTIETKESEDKIEYFSLNSGYVTQDGYNFSVSNAIKVDTATFRGTGHIESGQEKDIHVHITKKKAGDDSVGSGVHIDVNKLDVEGTVGSNTNIKANELNIGAQTHKKAMLEVNEKATVKLHRGNLKAREAEIEILETGLVEADEVKVDKMLGGEIIAKRVYVNTLIANAVITASELIEINNIEGNDNKLVIDPHTIPAYHKEVEKLETELKENKKLEIKIKNDLVDFEKEYAQKAARVKVFQKKIVQATKAGKKPNKADMIRVHQFKKDTEKYEALKNEVDNRVKKVTELEDHLQKMYEADLHAKIVHKSPYNGHTKIYFIDPKTHEEYYLLPDRKIEEIYLRSDENGKKTLIT